MLHKIQNFFLELQQSDENTKKRWLVILTSISMVIVISLWMVYINVVIQDLGGAKAKAESANFWGTFRNGFAFLSKEVGLKTSRLATSFQAFTSRTNSIIIQNAPPEVVLKNLEEIEPKKLP